MLSIVKIGVWSLLLLAVNAHAVLDIEITEGEEGALPIAIAPFAWSGATPLPEDIAAIISADLHRSGRFAPLEREALPAQPKEAKEIQFAQWRAKKIENLVIGKVIANGNQYQVQFQLFDALRGTQLIGYNIPTAPKELRRSAHRISDLIYEQILGQRGAFSTFVSYVTVEQDAQGKRRYRLSVADADGYNEQNILTSKQPLMSPAWASDGKRLAYVSFEMGRSFIYVQNIVTGKRELVAQYAGLNSAPAWSPDGRRLAMTLSHEGNAEIYLLEIATKRLTRVTRNPAIDTEPAWSPNGQSLAFTSDRGGRPQIYQVPVNADGTVGREKRLTFTGDYNARASFSPDGRRLTMVHGNGGLYRIAVQDLANGKVRVLTSTRLDESPSFAPNGSMIIYATERAGRGVLEAVSVDGRGHQRLGVRQGDVREPAWSPYINN
ncbi:MAG TPA: Tol-Pal system beta propeller repeat protein TolB [Gammaproteobacteria bacterium]